MVVGRTLWDFAFEVIRTPGFGFFLIALLIFIELILIIILLMAYAGLIEKQAEDPSPLGEGMNAVSSSVKL